jgi:hypothetical protein
MTAAILIRINARNPRKLEVFPFVFLPIIFLLFEIWRMMAINTGAVNP